MKTLLALVTALLVGTPAMAGTLTVHIGPPSVGTGGTNPTSIPPFDPLEYEVEWITKGGFESNIAITPGILFGARSRMEHLYVGFGGGLVISANGTGPGCYTSFGVNAAHFNAEIKQAIGWDFGANQMVSPYAIRLGMSFDIGKG